MNIIQAKHINFGQLTGKVYTYRLPDGLRIDAGEYILVENKRTGGVEIVKTVTNSEDVNKNVLKMIMDDKEVISKVLNRLFSVSVLWETEKEDI